MLRLVPPSARQSSFPLPAFVIVDVILLSTVCLFSDAVDHNEENCPPKAVVDLSNTTKTALFSLSFLTEHGLFFPKDKVGFSEGIWRGCLCDMIGCLEGCEPTENNEDVRIRSEPNEGGLNPEEPLPSPVRGSCEAYAKKLRDTESLPVPYSAFYLVSPRKLKIHTMEKLLRIHKFHCKTPVIFNSKVCIPENDVTAMTVDDRTHPLRNLKNFGGLIAVPFLFATVLIYSILPELRNTHGTTLRCYLCCLTLAHVTLAINRLSEPDFSASLMCLCLGFVIYCSSIASFLWLNVICFDLWSKFGDVNFLRGIGIQSGRKKMIWYSIYAWGITFAMTAFCVAMEFISGIPESLISPGFKSRACWFNTKEAAALYYSGPIGVTIACNVCFFIATAITLVRDKYRLQNALNSGNSNRIGPGAKSWFRLYTKLFVLMGISWSTETMSWLWEGPQNLWYYTDTVNALHGLLIFVVFICKKDIWMSLKERGKKIELLSIGQRGSTDFSQSSFMYI